MRRLTVLAVVFLGLIIGVFVRPGRRLDEARFIRNAAPTMVRISTLSSDEVYDRDNGSRTRYFVRWREPVGHPQQAYLSYERWAKLIPGDEIPIVVTPDGQPHVKGDLDDSLEMEIEVRVVAAVVGIGAALFLIYRGVTFLRRRRARAEELARLGLRDGDLPQYILIGRHFRIAKTGWDGYAVASADTLYLVLWQTSAVAGCAALFGLLGTLFLKYMPGAGPGTSMGTPYSELPDSIRAHPHWPINADPRCRVLAFARSDVEQLTRPRFSNELIFYPAGVRIVMVFGYHRGGKIRRFLEASGWPLAWGTKTSGRAANSSPPCSGTQRVESEI